LNMPKVSAMPAPPLSHGADFHLNSWSYFRGPLPRGRRPLKSPYSRGMVQADFMALGIEIQDRRLQPKEELPLQILLQMQRRSKLVTICDCCYRHIAGLVRAPVDRPREIAAPPVHQEPRATDYRGHCQRVHDGGAEPGPSQAVAVGRPFLGGRHTALGVGEHEELSAKRRQRRTIRWAAQRAGLDPDELMRDLAGPGPANGSLTSRASTQAASNRA